jgi:hypothetical protein
MRLATDVRAVVIAGMPSRPHAHCELASTDRMRRNVMKMFGCGCSDADVRMRGAKVRCKHPVSSAPRPSTGPQRSTPKNAAGGRPMAERRARDVVADGLSNPRLGDSLRCPTMSVYFQRAADGVLGLRPSPRGMTTRKRRVTIPDLARSGPIWPMSSASPLTLACVPRNHGGAADASRRGARRATHRRV